MDPVTILIQIAIAVVFMALSLALAPKPKKQKPPATSDLENPTAEAGRPVPVVFGTMTLRGANIIARGDKNKKEYEVS